MDNLPPDPGCNHASDDTRHPHKEPPDSLVRPHPIPSDRLPQFGFGCFLWLPIILLFFVTPLTTSLFATSFGWEVVWGIPLIGLIAAVSLMSTKKRRWVGIGLLAGLLLYCLIWGIISWIVLTEL